MQIIREIKFFKNSSDMKPAVIKEISQVFIFQSNKPGDEIIKYGDFGDHFFIIIQGKVSVKIPNPTIKGWKEHFDRFKFLKDWKNTKFASKMQRAKKVMFKLQADQE